MAVRLLIARQLEHLQARNLRSKKISLKNIFTTVICNLKYIKKLKLIATEVLY
jgi:hypothetical protein